MAILDLVGAALTVLALGFLGLGGYLAALALLGKEAKREPLTFAIAVGVLATAEALGIGLALGALGFLRIELALAVAAAIAIGLLKSGRRATETTAELGAPFLAVARRAAAHIRAHPALSLLALHAVGSEALRGLLRPPLSWDSLMYHLLLAASWFKRQDLAPVFGPFPLNYHGLFPGNGSIWLWWWLAPSHSELYVNLAFLPHWILFALAVGALARELGARRNYAVAALLAPLTPAILRFAATSYVDIFQSAALLSACFFGLRWIHKPRAAYALLVGLALGIGMGTKGLGIPYGGALALGLLVFGHRLVRAHPGHVLLTAGLCLAFGSYFYLRNTLLGIGPLYPAPTPFLHTRVVCDYALGNPMGLPPLRTMTVLAQLGSMLRQGTIVDAFLGIDKPDSLELGIGPFCLLLLAATIAAPIVLRGAARRGALFLVAQTAVHLFIWVAVPMASLGFIYANTRFLDVAIGIGCALGVVLLETWEISPIAISALAIAIAAQDLLQLHTELPRQVRLILVLVDAVAVLLVVSKELREWLCRQGGKVAVGGAFAAWLLTPWLGHFRANDRARALALEFTAHATWAHYYAAAWGWLDRAGGDGTVAVIANPSTDYLYPAMGMRLERRAIYVNVNRQNAARVTDYPNCDPRVDFDEAAWLDNLEHEQVRWVLVSRKPPSPYPREAEWIKAHPDRFALRFGDGNNRIYERLR